MHTVPAIIIDGHTIAESIAIIEYLEDTRPNPPLIPKDPYLRSKVRQISLVIASDIQPLQNLRVTNFLGEERKQEWLKHFIGLGMEAVEKLLQQTAGKYCVGDEVTMADCLLVPQIYSTIRFGVDMSKFPIITRIGVELAKLDPFIKAHADNQPDAVKS